MEFELCCDLDSLERAKSGAIWGNIWLDMSGFSFPEANWNDMPIAFLAELIDAFSEVRRGEGRRRRVRFFDGPFWLDLAGQGGESITILLNAHGADRMVTVNAHEVVNSLATLRVALIRACLERGWGEQSDIRRLQAQRP